MNTMWYIKDTEVEDYPYLGNFVRNKGIFWVRRFENAQAFQTIELAQEALSYAQHLDSDSYPSRFVIGVLRFNCSLRRDLPGQNLTLN